MNDYIQLTIAPNGNIKPCPYAEQCPNCPAGCKGESLWCGRDGKWFEKYVRKKIEVDFDLDRRRYDI